MLLLQGLRLLLIAQPPDALPPRSRLPALPAASAPGPAAQRNLPGQHPPVCSWPTTMYTDDFIIRTNNAAKKDQERARL
eukprot:1138790-Pelagomonas_calceolata.AAC.3